MAKTLLIISGGVEAVPGIQHARKMGYKVVVSDGNPNAPGFKYADYNIIASTYDIDETIKEVIKFNKNVRKINGVICIASDVPLTVASVSHELNLPSIPIRSALLAIDKYDMKNNFSKFNIPIPDYVRLNTLDDLINIIKKWGYPIIIKPVDNRGARGVLRITKDINLKWAWEHSRDNSPTGRVMAEKYLDGIQVSTESIILDGKCYTVGFADRNYEFLDKYSPYVIENGGDLPSNLSIKLQKEVKSIISKAAYSMGVTNGVVKGDIVINNGKPYIIELATRLSGGYFCTHEIPLNTGVDFVGNAIKIALDEHVSSDDLKPKFNRYISQRYIFPKKGIIKNITGLDKLKNNPDVKYFNIHVKLGEKIGETISHPSRAGMVITSGTSRENSIDNANKALKMIRITY